jgi:hypothetical protein
MRKSTAVQIAIALVLIAFPFFAAKADWQPQLPSRSWYIKGQAIPTSLSNLTTLSSTTGGNPNMPTGTLYVCQLDLSMAPGSSAVNVTLEDIQATPWIFFNAVPITPTSSSQGTTWTVIGAPSSQVQPGQFISTCRTFTGGMKILASATGVQISVSGF